MNHWHFIAPPNETVEKTLGIVRCGVCGRPLTDPESVAKGIGPVCEAHGVVKSFPGHKGRPGKVGGSLPRKAGARSKGRAETKGKLPEGWRIASAHKNAPGPFGFQAKAKQLKGGQWEARGHAPSAKYHKSTELPGTTARAKNMREALVLSVELIERKHKYILNEAKEIVAEHDAWVKAAPNARARRARQMASASRFVW